MPNRIDTHDINLDHIHSEAVCEGIAEKLRETLKPESRQLQGLSPDLRALIDRLPELDREHAPSLAPSMDELADTH